MSHVDQVLRSLISRYSDQEAQGIFKHRLCLGFMKLFAWAWLPFNALGKLVL
jgi:hypothetical protein